MTNPIKFTLRDVDGAYYSDNGLDTTDDIQRAMKFDISGDADRVRKNLAVRFILPFETVKAIGEPFGTHGVRWHVENCELCERFAAEMEDPTFDASRVLPGGRALWICEVCAKERIDNEMYKVVQ